MMRLLWFGDHLSLLSKSHAAHRVVSDNFYAQLPHGSPAAPHVYASSMFHEIHIHMTLDNMRAGPLERFPNGALEGFPESLDCFSMLKTLS